MPWITYARTDHPRNTSPLGGPYATLDEAKADKDRVVAATCKVDGYAWFWHWISVEVATENAPARTMFGAAATD
jgi:hypothetical protein